MKLKVQNGVADGGAGNALCSSAPKNFKKRNFGRGAVGFLLGAAALHGAQIPPFFADCVLALGRSEVRVAGQAPEWIPEASGFLYGVAVDQETDLSKHMYEVYLVTNRHVLANHAQIVARSNPVKSTDQVRQLPIILKDNQNNDLWAAHPNPLIDIAVVRVNASWLRQEGLQSTFFANDKTVADKAKMKEIGLSFGDGIFVLGFPMGLSGTSQRNYVIARRGSIARIGDLLEGAGTAFLIDALIFPGNSGGPVVSTANFSVIDGTKSQDRAYLIGVVRSYLPYRDIALSQQTGEARMLSEENSGLAEVVPVDYINETIAESKRRGH